MIKLIESRNMHGDSLRWHILHLQTRLKENVLLNWTWHLLLSLSFFIIKVIFTEPFLFSLVKFYIIHFMVKLVKAGYLFLHKMVTVLTDNPNLVGIPRMPQ